MIHEEIRAYRLKESAISFRVWLLSSVQLRSSSVTFGQRIEAWRAKLSPDKDPFEHRLKLSSFKLSPIFLNISAIACKVMLPLHWTMLSSFGWRFPIQLSHSSHISYLYFIEMRRPLWRIFTKIFNRSRLIGFLNLFKKGRFDAYKENDRYKDDWKTCKFAQIE